MKVNVTSSPRYWAINTTDSVTKVNYWTTFVAESVIAIGWNQLQIDPSSVSKDRLLVELQKTFSGKGNKAAADTIMTFIGLNARDLVLVTEGYTANKKRDVHIYGVARVKGRFFCDARSQGWRFKHEADVQVIGKCAPVELLLELLEPQTMRRAIHRLDGQGVNGLLRELGVQLAV